MFRGFSHALEWTRTTTGKTPHKALNLIRPRLMGSSSVQILQLAGSQDASDISGGASSSGFVTHWQSDAVGEGCRFGRAPRARSPAPCGLARSGDAEARAVMLLFLVHSRSERRGALIPPKELCRDRRAVPASRGQLLRLTSARTEASEAHSYRRSRQSAPPRPATSWRPPEARPPRSPLTVS
jgi:hypothetical protein